MNMPLKIMLLEDSEDDANLIHYELKKGGIHFSSIVVETREEFVKGIGEFQPDVVLSDHSMPEFNSAEALKIYREYLKKTKKSAPFILVTGTVSEEFAVQCIKEGADDYILKDRIHRLPTAIVKALERCKVENENQKSTAEKHLLLERYEYVTQATSVAIWDWDLVENVMICGNGFEKISGHKVNAESDTSSLHTAFICVEDIERVITGMEIAIEGNYYCWSDDYKYLKANGDYAFVQDNAIILRDKEGNALRMIGAMKDITSRKKEYLRLNLLESVITHTNDAVLIAEADSSNKGLLKIIYINEAFTRMTGYNVPDVIGKSPQILQGQKTNPADIECLKNALEKTEPCQVEMISYKKNGDELWIHFSIAPIIEETSGIIHWVFIERDITQQRNHIKAITEQNLQLKEIAWMQSHLVRAPLSKMMGFLDLINTENKTQAENAQLMTHVKDAAKELDTIIRKIVEKSENL